MSNDRWDDDDLKDIPELTNVIDGAKKLKRLYSTDVFDDLLDNEFIDYEDLGHLLIDLRILTVEDRDDFLQLIYRLYEAEESI